MNRVGRKPQGAGLVDPLRGSPHAKQRMTLILETLAGHCTVETACEELGIQQSRFFAQRAEWLQEALELLEPRPLGRPCKTEPVASPSEVKALRKQLHELQARAAAVNVQAELARTMPHLLRRCTPSKKKRSAPPSAGTVAQRWSSEVVVLSVARRRHARQHAVRRHGEHEARCHTARTCHQMQHEGVPVARVTRELKLSERTVRRWRSAVMEPMRRGRPAQPASRDERNNVYRYLRERGPATPLAAVRRAFPDVRRADLAELHTRFRRIHRRLRERYRSRLVWKVPGTVWAADFKERREPIEGVYRYLLSVKDLGSRCQLLWEPLPAADADAVGILYERLFQQYGPPLVMKADNGSQFKADETKDLLALHNVVPLYSPARHPQYNGGVERANGQLASYQEAMAEFNNRPAGPTCEDARAALRLANELARPDGWQGPTAAELWAARPPIREEQRRAFIENVESKRRLVREHWNMEPGAVLEHYQQAAVDRRAVRDALVEHGLLTILPRKPKRGVQKKCATQNVTQVRGAGILEPRREEATVGAAHVALADSHHHEGANSSTIKSQASGKN